ncbi:class I adenylate-forming enzyme family protein [Compostimonas suwonensis]|nr:AMP-binding protein [Compostimonas suwonensis]
MSSDSTRLSSFGPLAWDENRLPPEARTLPALLDQTAAVRPDADALVSSSGTLSYEELARRVGEFAASLATLGVSPGSRVALLAPNIEEWVVAAFAAMRLGVAVDSFNTWVRAWDLDFLLSSAKTETLIMTPSVRSSDLLGELATLVPEFWETGGPVHSERYPQLRNLITIGSGVRETPIPDSAHDFHDLIVRAAGRPAPENRARGDDAAVIVYTSGTTQYPKAVPLRHRHLIENGFAMGERAGFGDSERVWLGSPIFWSYGIANAAMTTLTHGGCLVLQERFTAAEAAQVLAREACTALYLLPSLALALEEEVAAEVRAIDSLRTGLIIGRGEEVERAIVELGIPELCNVYGQTETYGNCCVTPHEMPVSERVVTQGQPLPGVEVRIVDIESRETVPIGDQGEIWVRGRVTPGYLNNAEATREAITEDGWYRTGDLGTMRADGSIQFVSRHSDMIKSNGINISPTEVEAFIASLPPVEEVAVVGAPHPSRGEVPIAFVVPRAGQAASEEWIIGHCRDSVASFKVPWAVEFVRELPRTATGKLTRRELSAPAADLVSRRLAEV